MAAQRIDYSNPFETAYWCGVFSCDEQALIQASLDLGSCEVAAIGVYLAEHPQRRGAHRVNRDEVAAVAQNCLNGCEGEGVHLVQPGLLSLEIDHQTASTKTGAVDPDVKNIGAGTKGP